MEKLKSTNNICGICNGNGYIKITDEEDKKEVNVHQCWKCGSKVEVHGISLENSHIFDDDDYWNYIPNHIPKLK